MKWNGSDIAKFLVLYREYPLLWNIKDKGYTNKTLKEENVKRLMSDLDEHNLLGGMDVKQLKAKIKTVKDVHRQELQKIEKSIKRGCGKDEVYTPKLSWFNDANYLSEVTSTRKSISNMDMSISSDNPIPDEDTAEDMAIESGVGDADTNYNGNTIKGNSSTAMRPPEPLKKRCKKTTLLDKPSTEISQAITQLENIAQSVTEEKAYEQFGKYVAAELRMLPKREAILLQQEIQSSLTRAKLGALNNDQVIYDYPVLRQSDNYQQSTPSTSSCDADDDVLQTAIINTFGKLV